MKKGESGMTLIELLAVIAIIAILFILLIPQINSAIEKSRISGVQTDFHSYEVAARGYLMEVGDDEKTEEGLNKFLDKNLKSNSGEAKEKGPWGHPYKIKVDNEKKRFVFTTLDKNKEPRTHKMIVSWGDDEIKSKYTANVATIDQCGREDSDLVYTDEKYFTVGNYNGGVKISGYSSSGPRDVVIPCKIKGKDVVGIGAGGTSKVFSKSVNSVILNENLENIYDYAFSKVSAEEIIITKNVKEIGSRAFYGSENLKRVIFEEGTSIEKIGGYAFADSDIRSLELPDSLTSIGENSFAGNENLSYLKIGKGLTSIASHAFQTNGIENIYIPSNIKSIAGYAFQFSKKAKTLYIEEGVESIVSYTFGSTTLETVTLPSTITKIDRFGFYNSTNIKTIYNYSSKDLSTILNIGSPTIIKK